jgi:cytochrome c-type biogenesis protein CcmH
MSPAEREAFITSMVDRLAARLKDNGKDLDGWMRLARAYKVLGREGDAVGAVASARQNFAGDQAALAEIDKSAASLGLAAKQEPVTPQ